MIRNLSEGMAVSMSQQISGRFRLNWTEWRVLLQLAEHSALTASDIVEYSAMEKSKVSRAIASLEAQDLIVRRVSEEDHRVKLLAITETGMKRYRAIVPRVLDWEKDLIEGLDASEYRDLLFLLEKLKKQLKAMSAEVEPEQVVAGESGAAGGV
jgi:DNA-binding MarR family transcriptional regulator